jgi:hypothetical protein
MPNRSPVLREWVVVAGWIVVAGAALITISCVPIFMAIRRRRYRSQRLTMTGLAGTHAPAGRGTMDRNDDPSALSRWWRPVRQRAAAVALPAAALILAACSSGGTSAGGSPASTPLTPRQALLAAATQAQQITSATERLIVHDNTSGSTTTGTVQFRLKPTLLASENLNVTAAGTRTRIKMILTSTAIYLHEASLTSQLGKSWVKMDLSALSALAGTTGASLAKLVQSLQSNNFTNQAQLFAGAKNTRVAGTQTVDGVTTTEYAGSLTAAAALKALPASFRKALAPELQALGNSPVYFHEWVDGQHHLRKMTEVETVNGDTVTTMINITAINRPVHITLPRASQTFALEGSGPSSGNSGSGGLEARVIPAPPGFALSQAALRDADFNQMMGGGNPAASLHFVHGYEVSYNSTSNSDSIAVILFQFATASDATLFTADFLSTTARTDKVKADPVIPGAEDYDSTSPDQGNQGLYDHAVLAAKGNLVFVIYDATGSAAPVPLVETMARQQYAAL